MVSSSDSFLLFNQFLSKLCGLDLPKAHADRRKHYQNTHGITLDEASQIASSSSSLSNWRKVNGFTDIPGQCGYCFKKFEGYRVSAMLTNHRRSCKAKAVVIIDSPGSTSDEFRSTLEEIVNDSEPVLEALPKSQQTTAEDLTAELRDEIQKLIRQVDQLKDSKVNKLLAKSKSRQKKLESKVKMLKTENKKLLEKYVKLLETLLVK